MTKLRKNKLHDIRATCVRTPGEFWPKFRREFVRHSCNIRATFVQHSCDIRERVVSTNSVCLQLVASCRSPVRYYLKLERGEEGRHGVYGVLVAVRVMCGCCAGAGGGPRGGIWGAGGGPGGWGI